MVNIFILQKISPERDRLQLFCTFAIILDKFSAPMSSNFFLWKIWVITNSRNAANITWWVYWMQCTGWGRSSSSSPSLPPSLPITYLKATPSHVSGEAGDAHLLLPKSGWLLLSFSCSTTLLTTLSMDLLWWLQPGWTLQWLRKVQCSVPRTFWLWLWNLWKWLRCSYWNHFSLRSVLLWHVASSLLWHLSFLYSFLVVLFNALWYTTRCCHWTP